MSSSVYFEPETQAREFADSLGCASGSGKRSIYGRMAYQGQADTHGPGRLAVDADGELRVEHPVVFGTGGEVRLLAGGVVGPKHEDGGMSQVEAVAALVVQR